MDEIEIALPDGRKVRLDRPQAQSVVDRLWELGIRPGAALGAVRLTEALHQRIPAPVAFEPREADALDDVLGDL